MMAEACTESSFQPLLQLFLVLPCLLHQVIWREKLSHQSTVEDIYNTAQVWSITISILALSWNFSVFIITKSNYAISKLSLGFFVLFLQHFLQISGRLLLITLFAFAIEIFWAAVIFVVVHIVLVMIIIVITTESGKIIMKNVLMNSIANIYLGIWIKDDPTASHSNATSILPLEKKSNCIQLQKLFKTKNLFSKFVEFLIAIENIGMMLTISLLNADQTNTSAAAIALVFYYSGLFLKGLFYFKFHIWNHQWHGNLREKMFLLNKV